MCRIHERIKICEPFNILTYSSFLKLREDNKATYVINGS